MLTPAPTATLLGARRQLSDVHKEANHLNSSHRSCTILPSQNSSLPLALNWENIPETIVLNGTIGLILFIVFLILTHIAWKRSNYSKSEDNFTNQGLLTFLYGYREPDRWYVIPRYEFLHHSDRHHRHDMNYPNLYVPPRLPLASPSDLFGVEEYSNLSEDVDEHKIQKPNTFVDLTFNATKSPIKKTAKSPTRAFKTTESQSKDNTTTKSSSKSVQKHSSPTRQQPESTPMVRSAQTHESTLYSPHRSPSETSTMNGSIKSGGIGKLKNLDPSFFYPSILAAEQLQASFISRKLNQVFSLFFRVTDSQLIYAKGVILPIHLIAAPVDHEGNSTTFTFQQTTIKNMRSDSVYFWSHIASSVCIVIVSIVTLNSYRSSVIDKDDLQISRRTLLIGNIPKFQRNRAKLTQIFKSHFNSTSIEAIQFVYDINGLNRLQMQLDATTVARDYCIYYKRRFNREILVKPTDVNESQACDGNCRLCSFLYVCCCSWPRESKRPGTIYYGEKEQYYRERIRVNMDHLMKNPSEYAFVTFRSNRHARRFMERLSQIKTDALSERLLNEENADIEARRIEKARVTDFLVSNAIGASDPLDPKNNPYIKSIRSPIGKGPTSTSIAESLAKSTMNNSKLVTAQVKRKKKLGDPVAWSVRYAPFPDNVEYYDLLNMNTISKFTIALLHILMLIIFLFVTTPNVLLSIMERWTVLQPDQATKLTGYRGMFINYLSTLLQVITTALLPAIVTIISRQIPYEDSASKTHSTMWKVYLFLVLMVIVMPSIGMNSAQAMLSSQIDLKCWFPTDNGAYFINYVISSIFLSTVLELIKPVDILSYCFILWTGRSTADFEGGRQYIEREFSVSMQHTNVMLLFSVVMTYCISCPLIAPAGLVYLLVKHSVDHYHLYHTYFTKKVDKNMQNTIEIFVRVALLLMLLQTTIAIWLAATGKSIFSIASQIIFWISFIISIFNCYFHYSSKAISSSNKPSRFVREFCACYYLPRVIDDLVNAGAIPEEYISRKI